MRYSASLLWVVSLFLFAPEAVAKQPGPPGARPREGEARPATPAGKPAPAPGAAAGGSTSPSGPPAPGPGDRKPVSYVVRLRNLAQRIAALKERVSQTKYRLSLLKESVLHGTIGGAQLVILHHNKMGSSFRLVSMRYALDGKSIFTKRDISETKLGRRGKTKIYGGPIRPGQHVLTVQLKWRGHGYGVFSYLRGYKFHVLSSHSFKAAEGSVTQIRVLAYEKGNITTPLKDRPALKYKTKVRAMDAKAGKGGK